MHIQSQGEGPDVVLIHGWAMHGGIFHELAQALSTSCRVHRVDLPGHGFSRDDAAGFDVCENAERLSRLLPRAVWVGWSLGGLVAMQTAIAHPTSVAGLGLICASPRFVVSPDWLTGVPLEVFTQFAADLATDYRGTLDRFLALEVNGDAQAMVCLRALRARLFERGEPTMAALTRGLASLEQIDYRDHLRRIVCPNAWIAGSRDRLVPADAMKAGALAANGSFHRVARAGHAPFISQCDEVAAQIRTLIQRATAP